VHDTELYLRIGEGGIDRIREALQAVNTGNQDVLNTSILHFCEDIELEFSAFIFRDPKAQQFFKAFKVNA
jgi:hypothetical protein